MGRYNFTALQVRQKALRTLNVRRDLKKPAWLDVVGEIPPAQALIRIQPQQHDLVRERVRTIPGFKDASSQTRVEIEVVKKRPTKSRKASRVFMPVQMRYEEDELRARFYRDHPWELARPRIVLENDGKDHEKFDWSKMSQIGKKLDGESVVQRQLYLLRTSPDITVSDAYDIARKEFYKLRLQEDIERRVAAEEAEYTGAYFGKSLTEVGMELENQEFDRWLKWSEMETETREQRNAAFSGTAPVVDVEGLDPALEEDALDVPTETVPQPA